MKCIALDVHVDNIVVCAISSGGKATMSADVRTNAASLREFNERMNGAEHTVTIESSTYSYPAFRLFSPLGVDTHGSTLAASRS